MHNFDMSIKDNFALFQLEQDVIIVDSFDNLNFDVRFGTIEHSEYLGQVNAHSSEELNRKLEDLVKTI